MLAVLYKNSFAAEVRTQREPLGRVYSEVPDGEGEGAFC